MRHMHDHCSRMRSIACRILSVPSGMLYLHKYGFEVLYVIYLQQNQPCAAFKQGRHKQHLF